MSNSVYSFIIFGTAILTLLSMSVVTFVIYYQRKQQIREIELIGEKREADLKFQKQLLENSLEVQEIERRRLAKDLHDEVGAILSALRMNNNQLQKDFNNILTENQLMHNNKELIDESIQLIRSISKDLVPQTLENFGILVATKAFLDKLERNTAINFNLLAGNLTNSVRFLPNVELLIYRIIQELCNNAIKHANATEINLFFKLELNKLYLTFEDNGQGFNFEEIKLSPQSGLGLRNIESRLSVINGAIKVSSEIKRGSSFEIIISDLKLGNAKN